jgi:hypothetical protein
VKLSNFALVSAVILFSMISSVNAQSKKYKLSIKKIEIKNDLQSPSSGGQLTAIKSGPNKKWSVILVHYHVDFGKGNESTPKGRLDSGRWLNNIELQWNFLYKPKDAPKGIKYYTNFSKNVEYSDIGHGDHVAAIFIKPITLQRYFNNGSTIKKEIMIRLAMKVNGKSASFAVGNEKQSHLLYINGKLIKNSQKERSYLKAFDSDETRPLKNAAFKKNETPFSHTQYDAFDSLTVEDK